MPENTPGHSIPYPSPSDPIRGSTTDYILTDLRDLALGTDSAITTAVGTRAPLSHTHPTSDVDGLQGEIEAAVETRAPLSHTHTQEQIGGLSAALTSAGDTAQWGSVSGKPSAYPPTAHTHDLGDVAGLASRLALLEYDSGFRALTSLIDAQGANPGALFGFRLGPLVTYRFEGITPPSSGNWSPATFPSGFRPRAVSGAASRGLLYQLDGSTVTPIRYDISTVGRMIARSVTADLPIFGEITTVTTDTPPATPPGDPA